MKGVYDLDDEDGLNPLEEQEAYYSELDRAYSLDHIELISKQYGVPRDVVLDDYKERALDFRNNK